MEHRDVVVDGGRLHVAIEGSGPPLLLLHGWPEFWGTWEPVMHALAGRYRTMAPDLRGFGDSDKPSGPFGAGDHADDLVALLDALGVERCGVAGHDVGGAVMQKLARAVPERLAGLFFFDFVYPGIGARIATPDRLNTIWYQSFNQMDFAPALVGASRPSCRLYIGAILRDWSYRRAAIEPFVEACVDNFMKPGNLAGGFAYYRAAHADRVVLAQGRAPVQPPIALPTCVRWAEHDPLFPYAWTDRLGETFTDLDLARFDGVGHFPHREDPALAAAEIGAFFDRLAARTG